MPPASNAIATITSRSEKPKSEGRRVRADEVEQEAKGEFKSFSRTKRGQGGKVEPKQTGDKVRSEELVLFFWNVGNLVEHARLSSEGAGDNG